MRLKDYKRKSCYKQQVGSNLSVSGKGRTPRSVTNWRAGGVVVLDDFNLPLTGNGRFADELLTL